MKVSKHNPAPYSRNSASNPYLEYSLSRRYVLYVKNNFDPSKEHIYKITLPIDWENDEVEAVSYFYKTVDNDAKVSNVLTYEQYVDASLERGFEYHLAHKMEASPAQLNHLFSKAWIVDAVRLSLGQFYQLTPEEIQDSDILRILEKLEGDARQYVKSLAIIEEETRRAMNHKLPFAFRK